MNLLAAKLRGIETPKKEQGLLFDPKSYIPEQDWGYMKHNTSGHHNREFDFGRNIKMLAHMDFLFPERSKELDLDQSTWDIIKKFAAGHIDAIKKQENPSMAEHLTLRIIEYLAWAKTLYPERLTELPLETLWPFVRAVLLRLIEEKQFLYNNTHEYFFNFLSNCKIIFMKEFMELNVDKAMGEELKKHIKNGIRYYSNENEEVVFRLSRLVNMRVLSEAQFKSVQPELQNVEEKFKERIGTLDYERKLACLYSMKILTAKEIVVNEKGLEAKKEPLSQSSAPSLPETKKF